MYPKANDTIHQGVEFGTANDSSAHEMTHRKLISAWDQASQLSVSSYGSARKGGEPAFGTLPEAH